MYYKNRNKSSAWLNSLIKYLRDIIIAKLPIKRLPKRLQKLFYGQSSDFVFLVHTRRSQDFFFSIPALTFVRKIFGKKMFLRFMSYFPGKVVSYLKTKQRKSGVVLVSAMMPEIIISNRRKSLKELKLMVEFSRRISNKKMVIGLGGWWPIVSSRGKYLNRLVEKDTIITNGHTVTILSLVLMVQKISSMGQIANKDLKVLIIGAGKIGLQTAEMLFHCGLKSISFMDINQAKLDNLRNKYGAAGLEVNVYNLRKITSRKLILDKHHLAVCAVSATQKILKDSDVPSNFIIIDDSRPEAISRNINSNNRLVLEGGLMKINFR